VIVIITAHHVVDRHLISAAESFAVGLTLLGRKVWIAIFLAIL
jgi:hypothetical protein